MLTVKKIMVTPLTIVVLGAAVGFMPMQVEQAPEPAPTMVVETIPPEAAASLPTIVVPYAPAAAKCEPMTGAQRRIWVCDGRHTITFSEPQATCREVGRNTICERE